MIHRMPCFRSCLSAGLALVVLAATAWGARERPGPFVFIHGLQGPGAAQTAAALGCNTLYFDLPTDAPLHLDEIRALIAEASGQGLQVIIGLRTKLDGQYPIRARDQAYVAAVGEWVQTVVGGLRGTPGIVGWATDHYLERDLVSNEEDFRAFLLERYGSMAALDASWGTRYGRIDAVTRPRARELDAEQPYGVGRASVDVAEFERAAFRDVLALWADRIRRADPDGLLFTGRISLYRSLTAIPPEYDVVQVHMPTDILEPDDLTHNVQAVQIARRAGRFEVIPWLRVPVPPSDAYTRLALTRWVLEAGLRGAVGVGLEDWDRMSEQQPVLNNTAYQLAAALGQMPFSDDPPAPPAAVLYEPYAGGHEFVGTPAWGYLVEYRDNDLAELAFGYRLGTVLGGLDYLCVEDVAETDLDRYGAIFAPACLNLPPALLTKLSDWVERGGALFADLGAGMYQVQSWDPPLSPLAPLTGIAGSLEPGGRFGTYRVGETHPQLPSVTIGMQAQGTFVPGQRQSTSMGYTSRHTFEGAATEMKGYPFQGPSWFVRLRTGALPLATQGVRFDDQQRPHFLGISVNPVGRGLALFAPFACWSYWPPQDALHAAVHGDLMGRRARYRLVSPTFIDAGVGIEGSDDAVHLLSRSGVTAARLLAAAADHRAYLGAICTFSASSVGADGRRTGHAILDVELAANGMAHCQAIPVRIRPEVGQAHAHVAVYAPGLISLDLGGGGSQWGRERPEGPFGFHGGVGTSMRIGIDDGTYPVAPGSAHTVTVEQPGEQPQTTTETADHRGRLDFWVTVSGGRLTVTPALQ